MEVTAAMLANKNNMLADKNKHFERKLVFFHETSAKKLALFGQATWPPCQVVANQELLWREQEKL